MAAVGGAVLLGWAGLTIPQFFMVITLMNVAVAVFIPTTASSTPVTGASRWPSNWP